MPVSIASRCDKKGAFVVSLKISLSSEHILKAQRKRTLLHDLLVLYSVRRLYMPVSITSWCDKKGAYITLTGFRYGVVKDTLVLRTQTYSAA